MVRILQFLFVLYIGVSIFRLKAFKTKFFPIIGEQIENFYKWQVSDANVNIFDRYVEKLSELRETGLVVFNCHSCQIDRGRLVA